MEKLGSTNLVNGLDEVKGNGNMKMNLKFSAKVTERIVVSLTEIEKLGEREYSGV